MTSKKEQHLKQSKREQTKEKEPEQNTDLDLLTVKYVGSKWRGREDFDLDLRLSNLALICYTATATYNYSVHTEAP